MNLAECLHILSFDAAAQGKLFSHSCLEDILLILTKQYRTLTLAHHPDKNLENQTAATAKMQELNKAYAAVITPSDPVHEELKAKIPPVLTLPCGIKISFSYFPATDRISLRCFLPKEDLFIPILFLENNGTINPITITFTDENKKAKELAITSITTNLPLIIASFSLGRSTFWRKYSAQKRHFSNHRRRQSYRV